MYWKLAIVFVFFIIVDILGYKFLKLKRRLEGWIVLPLMVIGAVTCLVLQIKTGGGKDVSERSMIYQSYRYIQDGNKDKAFEVLESVNDENGEVLRAFAYASSGDYINAFFKSQQLIKDKKVSGVASGAIEELKTICGKEIGTEKGKTDSEVYTDFDSYMASLENYQEPEDEGNISYRVNKLLDDYMDKVLTEVEKTNYEKDYQLDRTLNFTEGEYLDQKTIDDIVQKNGETESVLKLECKYYASIKEYDKAVEKAKKLVKEHDKPENKVILTDIIADEAYKREELVLNDYEVRYYSDTQEEDKPGSIFQDDEGKQGYSYRFGRLDESDKEISSYLKKAKDKYKEAYKLEQKYGYEDARADIDKLKGEASEYVKKANYVQVERAANYILAQNPKGKDESGLYDLEMAKLNITAGNKNEAGGYLYNVINNSESISNDSIIKEELTEVVAEYNAMSSDLSTPGFAVAVNNLIVKQSQNVIPVSAESVNGSFNTYVENTLKYSKIFIHISRIDVSQYPTVMAYVNINGKKDENSLEELASDFTKDDFSLVDTQYGIKDFELIKSDANSGINISIVMDKSGSMRGNAISDAKTAAKDVVANMSGTGQRIGIVAYDSNATVSCPLTSSQDSLNAAIDGIYADGGTDIGDGLKAALDELEAAKGSGSIILMSDGQNGGSDDLVQEAIDRANNAGISIYAVAFGDADQEYMRNIAESTGGKFILAADSASLSDIYLMLQKYIINNYCFKYTVTQNTEIDPRYLQVFIPAYNTYDKKDYWIKEENKPNSDDNKSIILVDDDYLGISAVVPGKISVQDAKDGINLKIVGSGFKDISEVMIGGIKLTGISITNNKEMTGKLQGDLTGGKYDVSISTADGRYLMAEKAFVVYESGSVQSVKLGTTTIKADTIGRIGEKELLVMGNVMINNFLHCSGDMTIYADSLTAETKLEGNGTVYLGDSGHVEGDGKVYINYSEIVNSGGNALEKLAAQQVFAKAFIIGDYIVRNNGFYAEISKDSTDFDSTIGSYDLKVPSMMDVDVAEVKLYSDKLVFDVKEANPCQIMDSIKKSFENKKNKDNNNAKKNDEKDKDGNKKKTWKDTGFGILKNSSASIKIAATADGVNFGGSLTIGVDSAVKVGPIGLKSIEMKFDSLDEDHEYWRLGGALDLSDTIKPAGKGLDSLEISIASFFLLPDKIDIKLGFDGIVFCKVCELTEVNGGVQGVSTIAMKVVTGIMNTDAKEMLVKLTGQDPDTAEFQDVIAKLGTKVEVNLLAEAPENALTKKLKEWGKLGEGSADMELNLSDIGFSLEAKMNFFKALEKEIKIEMSQKKGLSLSANTSIDFSLWGASLSGSAEVKMSNDWTKTDIGFEVDGKLKVPIAFINAEGKMSVNFELYNTFDKACFTFETKTGKKDKRFKLWYGDGYEGHILFDKIGIDIR
ncbi:von Willebrand factor type A domain-containing protein [Eubacterium ruminantium]|nr:von Willebrand factor type A domain-containing protein [Eubacterium ruminantium]